MQACHAGFQRGPQRRRRIPPISGFEPTQGGGSLTCGPGGNSNPRRSRGVMCGRVRLFPAAHSCECRKRIVSAPWPSARIAMREAPFQQNTDAVSQTAETAASRQWRTGAGCLPPKRDASRPDRLVKVAVRGRQTALVYSPTSASSQLRKASATRTSSGKNR